MKIRSKLLLSFILVLLLPSLVIGYMSYQKAQEQLDQEIMHSAQEQIRLLDSIITDTVNPKIKDTNHLANVLKAEMYEGAESPQIRAKLSQYANLHPEVMTTYIGTNTGLMIMEPNGELPADYDPRQRPWYQEAMAKQGESIITEPYVDVLTGDVVITVAKATDDGSGVVSLDLSLKNISGITQKIRIGKGGYAFVLDQTGKYLAHPSKEAGSEEKAEWIKSIQRTPVGSFEYEEGQRKKVVFTTSELTGWKIAGAMNQSEVVQAAKVIWDYTLLTIAIALLIGSVLVYFIIRSIINPLRTLMESAEQISQGNLTQTIPVRTNDELGQLGKSFNHMVSSLRSVIGGVNHTVHQLAASSEELTASAEQTSRATEQITAAIEQVASGAENQTVGAEESSRSMEEIATGIQRIAENSALATESAIETSKQAEEGGKLVEKTVSQIHSIHQSVSQTDEVIKKLFNRSQEVEKILKVISDIAGQTNLLALNAAIEAARAGEQGRGFAVVADEVRKLAEQASQSSSQIAELIQEIQMDTNRSVEAMSFVKQEVNAGLSAVEDTDQSFARILDSMKEITVQIQEVSATAQQMSAGTQQVTASVGAMAQVSRETSASTQHVAASAEEQLASMEEITSSAASLSTMAEELQTMIGKFKI